MTVAFVDIESTGLHADRHEIWEVGLITPDGTEYQWMLPVSRLADADPIALGIGRFHQRHPRGNQFDPATKDERTRWEGFDSFARELARLTHGLHLAGAVISFDEERLRRLLWTQGIQPSWHYHLIDVEALAVGYIAGIVTASEDEGTVLCDAPSDPMRPPWDSNVLSFAVGVNPEDFDRHTALGDCRWAKAIYEKILGPAMPR